MKAVDYFTNPFKMDDYNEYYDPLVGEEYERSHRQMGR